MKMVSSIVRPERVDRVKEALHGVRVYGLIVSGVHDHSPQKYETTVWLGHGTSLGSALKVEVDVIVHDDDVDEVVAAVIRAARTGEEGDGFVSILPVEHRYNIRSGERDVS